ncbi:hypothetical protein F5144DRAFT_542429 [Chaetomium tenue]|uniref:Uncharacterized protein n=1 Tax=Chaetomium tenue TaxID=1854479 RepID=A0ACB7PNK8_9PEZI|nr:hypothetical protein F5144DRAFT_542429 [Chaetomium globosum]
MKWSFAAVGSLSLARGSRSQFLVEPSTKVDPNTFKNFAWWHVVASRDACALIRLPTRLPTNNLRLVPPASGTTMTSTSGKTTSKFTTQLSTKTTLTSTTTVPGNGVTTPSPIQFGIVGNCNKFHWVEKDQLCTIQALYFVSTAQFVPWNPAAKSDCSSLWTLRAGMLTNCNKFFLANRDPCNMVAFFNGSIATELFRRWNRGIGGMRATTCRGAPTPA